MDTPGNTTVHNDQNLPMFDIGTKELTPEDALKCLTGKYHVILPVPNSKPCNNLDEYFCKSTRGRRSNLNQSSVSCSSSSSSRTRITLNSSRTSEEPFAVPLVRNFDRILKRPQGASFTSTVKAARPPRKLRTNVFTRAEEVDVNSGPISHLKGRLNEPVKVTIRRRRKVPYISRVIDYKGTLVMFDKHMNLYLKDVIESFTYSKAEKVFKRARHRPSIVLRGDNIITVA